MANWLATELCVTTAFALGTWRSFKALKGSVMDYNLLMMWCLLAFVRSFEQYLEFLVAWIPFYYLAKCTLVVLLLLPESSIATLVFHNAVVPGMTVAHHALNHVVLPHAIDFLVALPWHLLVLVFPAIESGKDEETKEPRSLSPHSPCQVSRQVANAKKMKYATLQHLSIPPPEWAASEAAHVTEVASAATDVGVALALARNRSNDTGDLGTLQAPSTPNHGPGVATPSDVLTSHGDSPSSQTGLTGSPLLDNVPSTGAEGRGSIAQFIRQTVTGDPNIRVRDHLFDLRCSAPPPPEALAAIEGRGRRSSTASCQGQLPTPNCSPSPSKASKKAAAAASAPHRSQRGMYESPSKRGMYESPSKLNPRVSLRHGREQNVMPSNASEMSSFLNDSPEKSSPSGPPPVGVETRTRRRSRLKHTSALPSREDALARSTAAPTRRSKASQANQLKAATLSGDDGHGSKRNLRRLQGNLGDVAVAGRDDDETTNERRGSGGAGSSRMAQLIAWRRSMAEQRRGSIASQQGTTLQRSQRARRTDPAVELPSRTNSRQ
ncbi:unnamed protein product, partial [Chrysoparadoxa australica]